jgi:hypothetical protein
MMHEPFAPSLRDLRISSYTDDVIDWCSRNSFDLDDVTMPPCAYLVDNVGTDNQQNQIYHVRFVKCADPNLVWDWCKITWGEPNQYGTWAVHRRHTNRPDFLLRGHDNLLQFQLAWS